MNWLTEKSVTKKELSSGSWHLLVSETNGKEELYLCNYSVLAGPGADGETINECLCNFISDCEKCIDNLTKVKAEAEKILRDEQ